MNTLPQRTNASQRAKSGLHRLARILLLALTLAAPAPCSHAFSVTTEESAHATSLILHLDHPCQITRITRKGQELFCELPDHDTRWQLPTRLPPAFLALAREEGRLRLKLAPWAYDLRLAAKTPDSLTLTVVTPTIAPTLQASVQQHFSQPSHHDARLHLVWSEQEALDQDAFAHNPKALTRNFPSQGLEDSRMRRALHNVAKIPYSELLELDPKLLEPSARQKSKEAQGLDLLSLLFHFVLSEAHAAEASDSRVVRIAPQDIRARINSAGPEAWPEEQSLKTRTDMPDPDAKPEPPKPSPLSPEESFLDPSERRESAGTSFISEPLSPDAPKDQPNPDDSTRPFPKNEAPAAIAAPEQEERPFPKNEAPAVAGQEEQPFPKNETPQAVGSGDEKPFPKNETPQAIGSGDEKPFPKNETPQASDANQPAPKQEQAPQPKSESQVHGPVNTEQPGVIPEGPKEPEAPVEREVIYVDESGNPVEKPLDIKALMSEMHTLMEQKKYDDALIILDKLKSSEALDNETLEQVLYAISDCYWYRYEKDPIAGFDVILSTTNEALNFNLRSQRVPDALLRLCLINLSVGNTLDAEGYITAIVRRYPSYPGTPIGLTALAQTFLKDKKYAQAEKFFSLVLDKFPESSQLKDASVGLIDAFYHQKKFDRARLILDFVNKRWPRYYVDNPAFLLLQANLEREFQQTERQVATLWQLYNLQPSHEQTVPIFLEMADIYLKAGNLPTAEFLYQEIVKKAPESDEGLTASLRLAEKGFYESPLSFEVMFALFGRGSQPPFYELYQDLASRSRTHPDAVLARLKLALWLLWDKQYPQAMGKAADFIDEYPEHRDKPLAEEIVWKAFQQELAMALSEQNYTRILTLWNGFPLVRKRYGPPDAKLRYALAQGQRERGDEEGALNLMRTFLKSPMDPNYGEIAFLEFFNKYLSEGNWNAILDLGKTVEGWNLSTESRQDLNYAMALSAQNLNLQGTALTFWKKLAQSPEAQLYQKAWAMVFIAQDAERRKDIREAYAANLKVVEYFTRLAEERSDKADPERIKTAMLSIMDICEVANHIPEALQWANRFHPFAPENSNDYPALRYRESRLYRKLGDTNRSRALLEEIVRHYPDSPYAQAARSELETFQISRDLQSFQPTPQSQPSPSQP
ncbi:MAG: tetratricopeptide repeat protein [Desulfovibrio sp.]|nr:tetratricopeptide repeat protein [Desulfovibrio sp.]